MPEKGEWEAKDELRGIRGWLILPLAHLGLNITYLLWFVAHLGTNVGYWLWFHALPVPFPQFWAEAAPGVMQIYFTIILGATAYLLFCLVRFLQERREVPWLMTLFNAVTFVIALVALRNNVSAVMSVQALLCAVMIFYFHTSVRVKNTFFRRGA